MALLWIARPLIRKPLDTAPATPSVPRVPYQGIVPPSSLTATVRARLIDAAGKGAPDELAARYAGIAPMTLRSWRRAYREGNAEEVVVALVSAMEAAYGEHTAYLLEEVKRHAPEDWKAAAWLLERREPEHFSRRTVVHVGGDGDHVAAMRAALVGMDFYTRSSGRLKVIEDDVLAVNGNGNGHAPAGQEESSNG